MARDDSNPLGDAAARQKPFTFYAARGRIYARNVDQKLIDLGAISSEPGGVAYLLDGNQMAGRGLRDEETALRDMASKIRFLWLDGQFTAVADASDDPGLNLEGATRIDVTLDELPPGERLFDATV